MAGSGIADLLPSVMKLVDSVGRQEEEITVPPIYVKLEPDFWVEKSEEVYVVRGKRVERLIAMTNFRLPEGVERTQHILKKMGVERVLVSEGAKEGDLVKIGKVEFKFEPLADITSEEARQARWEYRESFFKKQ